MSTPAARTPTSILRRAPPRNSVTGDPGSSGGKGLPATVLRPGRYIPPEPLLRALNEAVELTAVKLTYARSRCVK
ncbi:hypothetical protein PR003_g7104 [Phytophthora rubi]|uniref:Uncharacterized protein n=1 Tax=Phytophthora rubi TaxID=129364 RepID=A0A6A3P5T9_9STRA|nr:hypothetical protein PR002_g2442 [Phytophthora rubi]KAE9050492.1 hypothetical protein PR001_g2353 [Phytophthora rubi]KAE9347100.1 hypothetical protein PR003_g7104 [Phytophthora rubi]